MRALDISSLAIQTAGYSGQSVPEIRIDGIVHAEELRELIHSFVRITSVNNDGTGSGSSSPKTTDLRILEELVTIRTLLQEQKK
jgi:hypothetical protein